MNNKLLTLVVFIFPLITYGQKDSADFYFQKGISAENNKQYLPAFNYFQKAIAFKADNADIQVALGRTAVKLKKFDIAAAAFQKGFALKKNELGTSAQFADITVNKEKFDEAIAYAKEAGILKSDKNTQYILGKTFSETKESLPSATINPSSAANPRPEDSKNAEVSYLIGKSFLDKQNYLAAAPFLEQAVRLDTTNADRIYECALNFSAIPDAKMAIKYYLLAAQRGYKADKTYYKNLSNAYRAIGNAPEYENLLKQLDTLKDKKM